MALTAYYDKMKNPNAVYDESGNLKPVVNSLIFALMITDMAGITDKKSVETFCLRTAIFAASGMPVVSREDGTGHVFTPAQLAEYMGLSVNVVQHSDAKFRAKIGRVVEARGREILAAKIKKEENGG